MKCLLAVFIALTSLVAGAQAPLTALSFRVVGDLSNDTYTFGAGQCADTVSVQWTNNTPIVFTTCSPGAMLKVWSSTIECGNTPSSDAVRYPDISALVLMSGTRTGTFTVKLAELPGFSSAITTDGGVVACGTVGVSSTHRVCGAIEYTQPGGISGCGTSTTLTANPLKLVYDTLAPGAPVITEAGALDQGTKVTFTADTDATLVQLEVRAQGEVDFTMIKEGAASNKSITGTGMVNGTTYDVRLRAVDAAGNISDPSIAAAVTPIKTLGFYGYYRSVGGTDRGCSAGWGVLPALGLWLLVRARQRRRNP
ncbi:MAG: hypothetical protein JNM17_25905 [Archangium sp.]|nr:hypothetical protein [Archangium sp.]